MKKFRKISPRKVKKMLQNYSKAISRLQGSLMWHEENANNLCKSLDYMSKKENKLRTYILVIATIAILESICLICQTIYM